MDDTFSMNYDQCAVFHITTSYLVLELHWVELQLDTVANVMLKLQTTSIQRRNYGRSQTA